MGRENVARARGQRIICPRWDGERATKERQNEKSET